MPTGLARSTKASSSKGAAGIAVRGNGCGGCKQRVKAVKDYFSDAARNVAVQLFSVKFMTIGAAGYNTY